MTVAQVMLVLGVKKSWVYARVSDGELPHIRMGAFIRFDPKDIAAYLESKKVKPARLVSSGLR